MSTYDPFAEIYDEWAAVMTEDVAVLRRACPGSDGPIVELGVGTGRVAIPVARETGRPVLGIDSSPAMLDLARKAASDASVQVELREGDMRELSLDEPAALIYCPFRALLHLPTWADRRRLFERVAASLRPGGRFAWNAFVFNPHLAAANDGVAEAARPRLGALGVRGAGARRQPGRRDRFRRRPGGESQERFPVVGEPL